MVLGGDRADRILGAHAENLWQRLGDGSPSLHGHTCTADSIASAYPQESCKIAATSEHVLTKESLLQIGSWGPGAYDWDAVDHPA